WVAKVNAFHIDVLGDGCSRAVDRLPARAGARDHIGEAAHGAVRSLCVGIERRKLFELLRRQAHGYGRVVCVLGSADDRLLDGNGAEQTNGTDQHRNHDFEEREAAVDGTLSSHGSTTLSLVEM